MIIDQRLGPEHAEQEVHSLIPAAVFIFTATEETKCLPLRFQSPDRSAVSHFLN